MFELPGPVVKIWLQVAATQILNSKAGLQSKKTSHRL